MIRRWRAVAAGIALAVPAAIALAIVMAPVLVKAGLALSHTFIHDSRSKIEEDYRFLGELRKKKP